MPSVIFSHPEPSKPEHRILPVFLPFLGCPSRCVYCSQRMQTGVSVNSMESVHDEMIKTLEERMIRGRPAVELAFYGGTFTRLSEKWQDTLLATAARYKELGVVQRIRCSTRPDAISPERVSFVAQRGVELIELGIQSFDDTVLHASGRGYTGDVAEDACTIVKEAGVALGVQLLPGLPAMTEDVFCEDIARVCAVRPETLRMYPCLVFKETELEKRFAEGVYIPWSLRDTIKILGDALVPVWEAGVTVIRLGVAYTQDVQDACIAGPIHQSLGSMIRARALLVLMKRNVERLFHSAGMAGMGGAAAGRAAMLTMEAPNRYKGEFAGYRGMYRQIYESMGLPMHAVSWTDRDDFCLTLNQ